MFKILIKIVVIALTVILAGKFLPGVSVDNYVTAGIVGLVLIVLNVTVKPILKILTLPISIMTLGLFKLVINTGIVFLAALIVPGFELDGIITAFIFGIIVSIVSTVVEKLD